MDCGCIGSGKGLQRHWRVRKNWVSPWGSVYLSGGDCLVLGVVVGSFLREKRMRVGAPGWAWGGRALWLAWFWLQDYGFGHGFGFAFSFS